MALLVALFRWLVRAQVADDYDSMNFLLGISHYDLAKFQPQFPGYPVFVALGAGLHRLGLAPLTALVAISCVASGLSALGIAVIAWRLAGRRAAFASLSLQFFAWLPLLLGSGALSESLGVALAATSFALLVSDTPHAFLSGMAGALMLGVRLSYWPLASVPSDPRVDSAAARHCWPRASDSGSRSGSCRSCRWSDSRT